MNFLERIERLLEEAEKISKSKYVNKELFNLAYVDDFQYEQWKIKVKNVLELISGKDSIYLKNFCNIDDIKHMAEANYSNFTKQYAILTAFKDDYEKGYIISLRMLIEADVFDTELEQAQELLDKNYTVASAVIAGIVLETALRSICDKLKVPHGKLDKMNADLAKAGLYNTFQQKAITALADIRNNAAHGKGNEFTKENVENMIKDIKTFLIKYLN